MMVELILVMLFGLAIGSFLNVCIYRLPREVSIMSPRSRCPNCDTPLRPWHNIPVISYLLLRGRCASCGESIGWVYPVVEIITAILLSLAYLEFGLTAPFLVNGILFCLLIILVFIDLFERILPNVITLGGAVAGFLLSPFQSSELLLPLTSGLGETPVAGSFLSSLVGALLGGGFLWIVAFLYFRLRKIEGMGFGDIKMMLMVGTYLGWQFTWLTIFLGSLLGVFLGSLYIVFFSPGRMYELPFGTFLGIAAVIVVLLGPEFVDWYFRVVI